jgi:hypothetical protein
LLGALLLALGPALPGCNLVAGALWAGSDSGAPLATTSLPAGSRELKVTLRPGVSLLQAAARAPHAVSALRGAARQLGDLSVLDGDYLSAVSAGLLGGDGVLLPGPLGALEISREIGPEPIAAPSAPLPPAAPGCDSAETPTELVGAYRGHGRLLLLRADGQFVLSGPGRTSWTRSGRYVLRCHRLQLVATQDAPIELTPAGRDGWSDGSGAEFLPLVDQHTGDARGGVR